MQEPGRLPELAALEEAIAESWRAYDVAIGPARLAFKEAVVAVARRFPILASTMCATAFVRLDREAERAKAERDFDAATTQAREHQRKALAAAWRAYEEAAAAERRG